MITEAQRRALFALREALRLCDTAYLMLALNDDGPGLTIETLNPSTVLAEIGVYLSSEDISNLLDQYPDA